MGEGSGRRGGVKGISREYPGDNDGTLKTVLEVRRGEGPKPRKHLFCHDGKHSCHGRFDAVGTGWADLATVSGKSKVVHDRDCPLRVRKLALHPAVSHRPLDLSGLPPKLR